MATTVEVKRDGSIFDELEQMQKRIRLQAYDLFEAKGRAFGRDLEHWLSAEKELIWKPSYELTEKDNEFNLRMALAGIDPKDIDIEVTPEYLLVKAETCHQHHADKGQVHVCELDSGNLFRSIQFPKKVDPEKVKAEFKNGMLSVRAAIAPEAQAQKVPIESA